MKKGTCSVKTPFLFLMIIVFSMGCGDPTVGEVEISFLKKTDFVSVSVYPASNEKIEIKKIRADGRRPLRIKLNIGNYIIEAYYQGSHEMKGVQVQSGKTSYLEFE